MELFVVEFGDSYDRDIVGIAQSMDEARGIAHDYLAHVHYMARPGAPYIPSDYEFFSVTTFVPGVATNSMDRPYQVLDLNG